MRTSRAGPLQAAIFGLTVMLVAPLAFAHPMGNFSINHYAAIRVSPQQIELRYVIDMAEIPTFQEMQERGIDAQERDARTKAYGAARAAEFARGLSLSIAGRVLPLQIESGMVTFPPGAGNLPTLRLSVLSRAAIPSDVDCQRCEIMYKDSNFVGRAGWKEVIATPAEGVSIASSSVPSQDHSGELANYSTELLDSPPQDLKARVVFLRKGFAAQIPSLRTAPMATVAGRQIENGAEAAAHSASARPAIPAVPAAQPHARVSQSSTPRNAFTELIRNQEMGLGFLLLAAVIAAGLGALHALEPGHGKTIVAAYLVGSRGTARHAFHLGLIVTASHTAGVYLLGAATMYAQKYVLPERAYPFLAVLSGLFIAGMGLYLFLQRFMPEALAHSHDHGPTGHHHSHGGMGHSHPHDGEHTHEGLPLAPRARGISRSQLLVLGITGGIVPCPAALVVLLSAAALHRVGFGLFLIVCFSMGLAAVLIAMGLVAIYAGRFVVRLPIEGPLIQRWLPMTSAGMITVIGCLIAARGLTAA